MPNGNFKGVVNRIAGNTSATGKYLKNEVFYSIQDGNWYSPSFSIDILCVGGGGGAGGWDGGSNSQHGGGGAAISASYIYSRGVSLTVSVGGGGGAGVSGVTASGGGTGGFNGGGAGGNAGGSGSSGGGGGGGGWSGVYHPGISAYLVVAGGGAGGGGANEGFANDATAAGGGIQNNGANGTSMIGTAGDAFSGDGGGFGGAGGGWYGGAKTSPTTGASSGGGNLSNTQYLTSIVTVNGFDGARGYGGESANITWYGYTPRDAVGRGGNFGNMSKPGANGIVIIRYAGNQKASGGNVTTVDGFTFHVFSSPGTFLSSVA